MEDKGSNGPLCPTIEIVTSILMSRHASVCVCASLTQSRTGPRGLVETGTRARGLVYARTAGWPKELAAASAWLAWPVHDAHTAQWTRLTRNDEDEAKRLLVCRLRAHMSRLDVGGST